MDDELMRYRVEKARAYMTHIAIITDVHMVYSSRVTMLRAKAEGVSAIDYSAVKVNGGAGGDIYARLLEAEQDYDAHRRDYIEAVREFDRCTLLMEPRERSILRRHYIGGASLVEIADDLGIGERWCRRLHLRALNSLYDYMPHIWRDPVYRAV